MKKIEKILICGAGMMGKSLAYIFAADGAYDVLIYSKSFPNIGEEIRKCTKQLVEKGIVSETYVEDAVRRIAITTDIDYPGIKDADLVIEAVYENMQIKQQLFAELEKRCRKDCLFATNSSVMSPSEISRDLVHRERFMGTHFWNPAHLIPLVEVIRSDATSQEAVDMVMDLLRMVGKKPVLCRKDVPGFIANRLQHALWREAISIVEHGIADAVTVDEAVKYSFGLRLPQMAPMENADMVGTDLTYNIHSYILPYLEDSHKPSPLLEQLCKEGKLGFKTGEGFRKWTDAQKEDSIEALNNHLIKMLYGR